MVEFSLIKALRDQEQTEDLINEIEKGNASIHEKDEHGFSVLVYAIEWGLTDFAEFLIQKGAVLNEITFYVAALTWNVSLIKLHLEANLSPDLSYSGYTPLNTAIAALDRHMDANKYGSLVSIVDLLIDHEADVNFKNEGLGQSALHLAAHYGAKKLVTKLLQKGADISAEDNQGYSPLHHVCLGGYDISVIQQLLDTGADINIQDSIYGQTPLHLAVLFYRYNAVVMLKQLGANQYIRTSKELPFKNEKPYFDLEFPIGTSPLDIAKKLEMDDIRNVLLAQDWDVTFV